MVLLITVMPIPVFTQGQQDEVPQMLGDWFSSNRLYFGQSVYPSFKHYSRTDLEEFETKVEQLRNARESSPWDGIYESDLTEVGLSQLRVKMGIGFVGFYVYSCVPELRTLNYGTAQEIGDIVILTSQTSPNSPRRSNTERYVKVTWGDRHYLVEESSLKAFAEKAAGVFVEAQNTDDANSQTWANYWISGNTERLPKGLPKFPKKYESLKRLPINVTTISVSEPRTEDELQIGNRAYYNSRVYSLSVNMGELDGVRKGMVFRHRDDELVITSTQSHSALGLLVRSLSDNGVEQCGFNEISKCLKLTPGVIFSTPRGEFHW